MKRFISLCLAFCLCVSAFGCSKESDENVPGGVVAPSDDSVIIEENSIWYETERIDISAPFYADGKTYTYVTFRYLGMLDDLYCYEVHSEEAIPADVDYENVNFRDYRKDEIMVVDGDGTCVSRINISDYLDSDCEHIDNVVLNSDVAKVVLVHYGDLGSDNAVDSSRFSIDFNLTTGEVGGRVSEDIELPAGFDRNDFVYYVGDYRITTNVNYNLDNNARCKLAVTDSSDNTTVLNMGDYFPELNIQYLYEVYEYGENGAFIRAEGEFMQPYYLCIDFSSMTMTNLCPDGNSWFAGINFGYSDSLNGNFYSMDKGKIKKLDFENNEVVDVFDFNDCNINRYDIKDCDLVDFTEDSIVLSCRNWHANPYIVENDAFYLYKLTRCDENPNAGKAVLEVGCINGISRPIGEAIFEYNQSNENFFIKFDTGYSAEDNIETTAEPGSERWQAAVAEMESELSYQMAVDLLSGDGPDIIIDGFGYSMLNNPDYLLDLTGYMAELDSSLFFENVFSGSQIDGSIYQLPISFGINGIITDASNVEPGQVGFTFDQYEAFVDEVCNGTDPIAYPQLPYMNLCLQSMSDLFIEGRGVNYDNEAFRELADYIKDNVYAVNYFDSLITFEEPAFYLPINGFGSYLNMNLDTGMPEMRMLGMPSYDGRSPSVSVINSVGISSGTVNPDACWDFIKVLLGTEVQDEIAIEWSFPVNRTSYETTADMMLESYNSIINGTNNLSFSGMAVSGSELNSEVIDGFAECVILESHVAIPDPTIELIIREEIQPYFAGQKSIDEVIEIMQDRIDTVIAERG